MYVFGNPVCKWCVWIPHFLLHLSHGAFISQWPHLSHSALISQCWLDPKRAQAAFTHLCCMVGIPGLKGFSQSTSEGSPTGLVHCLCKVIVRLPHGLCMCEMWECVCFWACMHARACVCVCVAQACMKHWIGQKYNVYVFFGRNISNCSFKYLYIIGVCNKAVVCAPNFHRPRHALLVDD